MSCEEIDLARLVREPTLKEDIMERFKPSDEIITCGTCHKETKLSRDKFLLETFDATTKLNLGNALVTNLGINVRDIAEQAKSSED